jgi:hypothetical protein
MTDVPAGYRRISQDELAEIGVLSKSTAVQSPPTCGNCKFAKRLDIQVVECHGVPPTPVVIAGSPGPLGKININVELMRARMSINEPACALWALNPVNGLLNLPGMKRA